eukprot:3751199-Prorocentrum_lima.AAC.1
MTSSLVGSEMCIRDRSSHCPKASSAEQRRPAVPHLLQHRGYASCRHKRSCLLYTSDAADDM